MRMEKIKLRSVFTILCLAIGFAFGKGQDLNTRERELQFSIDQYLNTMADSGCAFSVLVASEGKILLQNGYGNTDSLNKYRTTERTLFNIASITKSFTAIAIFQLREKGKLSLDDSLPVFFRDVPKEKESIRIKNLLVHTSGLGQHYAADGAHSRKSAITQILDDSLKFSPGTDFSYSNENYELLAGIIEIVSGKSYEQFVRENILIPSNMNETKFWDEVDTSFNPAIARTTRTLEGSVFGRNWGYIGSGGIYSNVVELYHWFNALLDEKLLTKESLALLWEPQKELSSTSVAYGWFLSKSEDGKKEIWTRGTEDWGHNGVLRWFPEDKRLIIVQSNSGERGNSSLTWNRIISDKIIQLMSQQ